MENKTKKVILKTILFFPLGFGFWVLIKEFDLSDWVFPVIAGFVFAFGIVFWQVFDYEKFSGIGYSDFLESKHNVRLENTTEIWNEINEMVNNQFANLKVLDKSKDFLKVQIKQRFQDSILTVERRPKEIIVTIEKKFLNFLPDNADNYRTLIKFANKINANTSYAQV